jgi:hypothetical protein
MSRTLLTGSALGFTAGYVDTVGFVALFGLFTAHVTGNFIPHRQRTGAVAPIPFRQEPDRAQPIAPE